MASLRGPVGRSASRLWSAGHRTPTRPTRSLFTSRTAAPPSRFGTLLRSTVLVGVLGAGYLYISDSRAGVHRWVTIPILHAFTKDDPELAHRLGVEALKANGRLGLVKDRGVDGKELEVELWGHKLQNPIGMAAGFDKHGEAIDGLLDVGFGYVEIGSVTPLPQPGNPLPRMFRLPSTESLINRYGFNSEGHFPVLLRLRSRIRSFIHHHALSLPSNLFVPISPAPVYAEAQDPRGYVTHSGPSGDPVNSLLSSDGGRGAQLSDGLGVPRSLRDGRLLGINLGKNKTSAPDDVTDYVDGVRLLGPYADVLVINVSSPNTPGLRGLQRRSMLEELLSEVVKERDALEGAVKPKVVLKIAPDLSPAEVQDVGEAAVGCKVDGIIVSNTTVQRPEGCADELAVAEIGGLSGPPLKPLALQTLSILHAFTAGELPLIGCGGIRTGQDALDYAKAGASLVQLYTALGYQGIGLPRKIKDEISQELSRTGKSWKDVVGSSAMKKEDAEKLLPPPPPPPTEASFEESVAEVRKELDDLAALLAGYDDQGDSTAISPSAQAVRAPPHEHRTEAPVPAAAADSPIGADATVPKIVAELARANQVSVAETAKGTVPDAVVGPGQEPTSGFVEPSPTGVTRVQVVPDAHHAGPPQSAGPVSDDRGVLAGWRRRRSAEQASGDSRRQV